MPEDARMPAAEAARQGQPIFLGSPEAQVARFPALAGLETTREQRALAVLPLLARGQVVGVLRVGFHEPRRFDEAERSFLESLASQAGLALERARGYQAEQRARAEASRVGVLQERLLAVVGHDLRTPLTAITMSAAMLQRRGGLTPDQAVAVARIDQGAARMAALIQDLLDLSRVRQGLGLALRPGQADLAALAREAVHEQEAAGEPGRMALSAEGDTVLAGDGARLAQVLSNLLGNALRHGAGTPVRVSLLGREDEVVLRVENGGPPIPAALLPHVFEPFRHGGGAGASVGLGLFIVHEIVRAHGGEVAVRSDAAEGTCVTVRLPRGGPGRDGTSAERRARGAPARSPVRRQSGPVDEAPCQRPAPLPRAGPPG
jgi:signal transduction histidine kinase